MKKTVLLIISFFCVHLSFTQNIARVKSYLDTLCSPGMHGRGYVSDGEKIAAHFLEDRFREIRLLPFNNNQEHPYFQYFTLDINTFPGEVFVKVDKDTLITGKDYILHPASGSGNKCLKIHWLDTTLFTDKSAWKKFLKLKTENLCLVAPVYPNYKKKWETDLPDAIAEKFFSAGCIVKLQQGKLTASLAPVQFKQPFIEILESSFPKTAKKITVHVTAQLKQGYKTQNVVGFIPGKTRPDSFVVISAHYDHLGRMGCQTYFPGANDNGSGVSLLLELARYYKENPPSYSIVFIAFGAEEAGLVGSKYFTNNPLIPLSGIRFLINLDLEGTGEEGITVVNATKFSKDFDLLTKINEEKKYLVAVKPRGPAANSDHYYFTLKGVPSFFIYTMGGIAAYHDIYDRPETLPLTKFSQVYQLLTEFILKLETVH